MDDLTPLEHAIERAAQLIEQNAGQAETRAALDAVERERFAEQVRAQRA